MNYNMQCKSLLRIVVTIPLTTHALAQSIKLVELIAKLTTVVMTLLNALNSAIALLCLLSECLRLSLKGPL